MTLFSHILSREEIDRISLFSYFHILENGSTGEDTEVSLLPSDHGLAYPLSFKKKSKDITKGELNFYNKYLYENYSPGNLIPEEKYRLALERNKDQCIVVNVLDNCYGHSVLKLLHLRELYEKYSNTHDLLVIVPENLVHYLPKKQLNICTVKLSYREMEKCYCLDNIIQNIRSCYKSTDFAVLDMFLTHPDREGIASFFPFFGQQEKKVSDEKYINFYYRKELWRSWGITSQGKNIVKLFKLLRNYYNETVKFCVVGDLDSTPFPDWIIDKRVQKFSTSCDFDYNSIFKNSIITIGVTGSNLLLPSILSGMTVHLIPSHKLGNAMEDTVNYISPVVFGWHQNISLPGNAILSDYPPELLSELIIMFYRSYLNKEYKRVSVNGLKHSGKFPGQMEYIAENFDFFDYKKAEQLKLETQKKAGRKIRMHNFFEKISKLFSIKKIKNFNRNSGNSLPRF